jgi:hypothetical protein
VLKNAHSIEIEESQKVQKDPIGNLKSELSMFTTTQLELEKEGRKLYGSKGNFESLEASPYISTYEELSKIKALRNKLKRWTSRHHTKNSKSSKRTTENRRSSYPKNIQEKMKIPSYTNYQQCPYVEKAMERMIECKFAGRSNCWNVGTFDLSCRNTGLCCFDGCFSRCLEEPRDKPTLIQKRKSNHQPKKTKRRPEKNNRRQLVTNNGFCPSYVKPSNCYNFEPSNCRAVGKHDLDCPKNELCCFNGCYKRCLKTTEEKKSYTTTEKYVISKPYNASSDVSNFPSPFSGNSMNFPWIHSSTRRNDNSKPYSSSSDKSAEKRKSHTKTHKKHIQYTNRSKRPSKSKSKPKEKKLSHRFKNDSKNETKSYYDFKHDSMRKPSFEKQKEDITPILTPSFSGEDYGFKDNHNDYHGYEEKNYESFPYFDYGDYHADDIQPDLERHHGVIRKKNDNFKTDGVAADTSKETYHDAADIDHYVDMTNEYVGAVLNYALKDEEIFTDYSNSEAFDKSGGHEYHNGNHEFYESASRYDHQSPMYHSIGVRRQQENLPMHPSANYNPNSPVVIMHIYGQSDGGMPAYDAYSDYGDSHSHENEWGDKYKKENRYSDININAKRRYSYGNRNTYRLVKS